MPQGRYLLALAGVSAVVYFGLLLALGIMAPRWSAVPEGALLRVLTVSGLPYAIAVGLVFRRAVHTFRAEAALRDEVTGLPNRTAFVSRAEVLLAGARPGSIAIALFAVRDLKVLNERCGHRSGDDLLRGAARLVLRASGRAASAYRAGGDTLAVLVDRSRGSRLSSILQGTGPEQLTLPSCGHDHTVRLFTAFASCTEGESFEKLFRRCEGRMDEAKRSTYEPVYVAPDVVRIEGLVSAGMAQSQEPRLSLIHNRPD